MHAVSFDMRVWNGTPMHVNDTSAVASSATGDADYEQQNHQLNASLSAH
jgi:hypothetical protein